MPPFLYHETERCGTLGGLIERLPEMLKWGNLICGSCSLHLKKKPLILSSADLTVFFADSIGVVIADLMPFHTDAAVDLIPLNTEETVDFTLLNTEDTLLLMPSTTVEIAAFIPFHTEDVTVLMALNTVVTVVLIAFTTVDIFVLMAVHTVEITAPMAVMTVEIVVLTALTAPETTDLMDSHTAVIVSLQFSQIKRNGSVIISNAASKIDPINWIPTETTFLMVSQTPVKKDTIPFQIFAKNAEMPVHTSFHEVPNQPSTVSAMP